MSASDHFTRRTELQEAVLHARQQWEELVERRNLLERSGHHASARSLEHAVYAALQRLKRTKQALHDHVMRRDEE
jgi:hypothetical protein